MNLQFNIFLFSADSFQQLENICGTERIKWWWILVTLAFIMINEFRWHSLHSVPMQWMIGYVIKSNFCSLRQEMSINISKYDVFALLKQQYTSKFLYYQQSINVCGVSVLLLTFYWRVRQLQIKDTPMNHTQLNNYKHHVYRKKSITNYASVYLAKVFSLYNV